MNDPNLPIYSSLNIYYNNRYIPKEFLDFLDANIALAEYYGPEMLKIINEAKMSLINSSKPN